MKSFFSPPPPPPPLGEKKIGVNKKFFFFLKMTPQNIFSPRSPQMNFEPPFPMKTLFQKTEIGCPIEPSSFYNGKK